MRQGWDKLQQLFIIIITIAIAMAVRPQLHLASTVLHRPVDSGQPIDCKMTASLV